MESDVVMEGDISFARCHACFSSREVLVCSRGDPFHQVDDLQAVTFLILLCIIDDCCRTLADWIPWHGLDGTK